MSVFVLDSIPLDAINVDGQRQLQANLRQTFLLKDPQNIQIYRSIPPGFKQYGCCQCIPVPKYCACCYLWFGDCCCCIPSLEDRQRIAASRFIHVTENGLIWNNADLGCREECCYGCCPCNCCQFKVYDDIKQLPWDNLSLDHITPNRRCSICDCCTRWGFCCTPYTCGTKWCALFPCLDVWPLKVCFIEGCEERLQFCHGGDGVEIKMIHTYFCGCCIKAVPGCCCLWPKACPGNKSFWKLCCRFDSEHHIYAQTGQQEEIAQYLGTVRDQKRQTIVCQPR